MFNDLSAAGAIREVARRPVVWIATLTAVGFLVVLFVVARGGLDRLSSANQRVLSAQGQADVAQLLAARERWSQDLVLTRRLATISTALNLLLVAIAAVLLAYELRRRDERVSLLDEQLKQRVDELADLSSHLQRVQESEKAALARELHDELGGLLIASKMDAVWLQRRLPDADPDIRLRLQRIAAMIDSGVDFKRRVVENLRPTLLDNMGLVAALDWMLQETCGRAHLELDARFPDAEPTLDEPARIAVFRIVQEALANIVKHAKASRVVVRLYRQEDHLVLTVRDDGCGMNASGARRGAHGLVNMRHRALSLGGSYDVSSASGAGTLLTVRLPLASGQPAGQVLQPLDR